MSFFQSTPSYGGPITSQAPDFQGYQKALTPQFQQQPGLLDMLAQSAGSGLGEGVASGIQQHVKNAVLEKALSKVKPNMSALERQRVLGGAGPEAEPYINSIFQQEAAQNKLQQEQEFERQKLEAQNRNKLEQEEIRNRNKLQQEEAKNKNRIEIEQIKAASKVKKGGPASKLPEEEKAGVQQTFDRMTDILKEGRLGSAILTGGTFNRQRQEDAAEFDALNIQLESIAKEMVSKGVLAKDRFKFMIDNLPNSADSDRKNQGKLKAISKILGLDASQLYSKENSKEKKFEPGQALEKFPSASSIGANAIITDNETGQRFISDGKTWKKLGG